MLDPLLFLIYINDIDRAVDNIKLSGKFADDTEIGHIIHSQRDNLDMQRDNLADW